MEPRLRICASAFPPYNSLQETDIMIKSCSKSCYVLKMNRVASGGRPRLRVMRWRLTRTQSGVRWPKFRCYRKVLCPLWCALLVPFSARKWGVFPFQQNQVSMTLISFRTWILYKIVISSGQQGSFSLQIKAIAGEWWIFLVNVGASYARGENNKRSGTKRNTWEELPLSFLFIWKSSCWVGVRAATRVCHQHDAIFGPSVPIAFC